MTNHWIDIRNSDRVMIIGSNAAENHPISFKWVTAAKERGGKLISVDPRFTRTSSKADIYAPMRSGTDITFIGGMIRYILNDMQSLSPAERAQKYNMTYVAEYTNAAFIINDGFEGWSDPAHPGLFVGFNGKDDEVPGRLGTYDKAKWKYANTTNPNVEARIVNNTWTQWSDLNENSVLRKLWENYEALTPEKVEEVTGCPVEKFLEVCEEYAASGAPGKSGTIMYAMGTTQHTYGTQNIRGYAIMQLLLANIGVAGGGINALRGTSNVQGSTDMCLLSHILPGYLSVVNHTQQSLNDYISKARSGKYPVTPVGLHGDKSASWWWLSDEAQNYKKYLVSLLKAWYMDNATGANDFCFNYLPKVTSGHDYTHIGVFEAMASGTIKGMMVWGQNPMVAGPDSQGERHAMDNLDWLMVADLFETETAAFWKRPDPESADETKRVDSSKIGTEVFLLPAACSYEKQGSISNSGRWAQWRYKAIDPIGGAKPDLAIIDELVLKLKEKYAGDNSVQAEPINKLYWDYRSSGEYEHEADPNVVAREIHGYNVADGSLVKNFVSLKTDGSTCCGNWLYSGMFDNSDGRNRAKDRDPVDSSLNQIGLYSGWTWCWPINRRIIYNRASVDFDGQPFDSERPVIQRSDGAWLGDVPDGGWPAINEASGGSKYLPFIMHPEGVAHIWGPGRVEGPFPVAYEPWESPLEENLVTGVVNSDAAGKGTPGFNNPCCYVGNLEGWNKKGTPDGYPYIGMTYRVSEHWQAGQMTRNHPWLAELQPEVFAEIGPELAADKGIANGDKVKVLTARGFVNAVAIVTSRMQRMTIGGKTVDHVGVPWHWGFTGRCSAFHSSGNILTPHVGDANTTIPEYKTFLCDIIKV
jgi:formate dehydrogenase-N alpha subunit